MLHFYILSENLLNQFWIAVYYARVKVGIDCFFTFLKFRM